MRGGALPPALLFAAFGLALSFAPRRDFPSRLGLLAAVAVLVMWVRISPHWQDAVFLGCWLSVIAAAASVHLPGRLISRLTLVLAINTGLWAGAVISAAGGALDLLKSAPLALLCLPGGWLVSTKRPLAIKILASWLIAIAFLAGALQLTTPTPGYVPDHMD